MRVEVEFMKTLLWAFGIVTIFTFLFVYVQAQPPTTTLPQATLTSYEITGKAGDNQIFEKFNKAGMAISDNRAYITFNRTPVGIRISNLDSKFGIFDLFPDGLKLSSYEFNSGKWNKKQIPCTIDGSNCDNKPRPTKPPLPPIFPIFGASQPNPPKGTCLKRCIVKTIPCPDNPEKECPGGTEYIYETCSLK
jgi:hypothetical protein